MSIADKYFKEEVEDILTKGFNDKDFPVRPVWVNEDGSTTPAHTIKTFCRINRYNLQEEFPVLTLRNAPFKYAVRETLWMFQKKSNDVRELGSKNWDSWTLKDENGNDWNISAKSLLCSLVVAQREQSEREHTAHEVDWNTIWCVCEKDIYSLISEFVVVQK